MPRLRQGRSPWLRLTQRKRRAQERHYIRGLQVSAESGNRDALAILEYLNKKDGREQAGRLSRRTD